MALIDVSRQRRSFLQDSTALHHLPPDLLDVIQSQPSARLLDAVAQAALIPALTDRIYAHFENVFPDICARWALNAKSNLQRIHAVSAAAKLLPFSPDLATFLRAQPAREKLTQASSLRLQPLQLDDTSLNLGNTDLTKCLLAIWRLLSFDLRAFGSIVSAALMQNLFAHDSRAVRYLAIRIFCQLLYASDKKLESLVQTHVGDEPITAEFDGVEIDYGFLSLHEHERAKKMLALRQEISQNAPEHSATEHYVQQLTPYSVAYGQVVLPRPYGPTGDPASLVLTDTTMSNLESFAKLLRNPGPILLHGASGVGKTALVQEIATQLGMHSEMVTLHLNEQTDAKMLIGLYSTDSKPGSFQWRPGVLTTAVKEGRWVLVEDLDRAPTEVLSTLLPLIERNELLIPSRGETIRAASTFRLLATVRTSRGLNGRENLPSLVGMRFWQSLHTDQLTESELERVVVETYPILQKYITGILAVNRRLARLSSSPVVTARGRSVMERQSNLRDLLKWCRRLKECLLAAGSTTGEEPISETTRDWMFMEAVDCFLGSCPDVELSKHLAYAIAEEMHLSRERAEHYLTANIPPLNESETQLAIGRVTLRKKRVQPKAAKPKQTFASTVHAKRLLEQIAVAVKLEEPVLLVGETGIGKTTVVQQLAEILGNKLIAVNLSQQSEVGDLLGGFKPVNVRSLAVPLKEEFEDLFDATGISASKNQKYLEQVGKCFVRSQWSKVAKLWKEAPKMFAKIVSELEKAHAQAQKERQDDSQPTKRRKTHSKLQSLLDLRPRWETFARNLEQFEIQIAAGPGGFAFSFVEGNLVKALRNGDWVLLDEINLASPDTLESIADLLTGPNERPSILLSETGEIQKIIAHPNFRIFGAMNPATDIGKRDLPAGIRSRFTELYVKSPDADEKDLLQIIKTYLGSTSNKNDKAADDIARLYLNTKKLAEQKRIVDGANEVPHFSLRTLTRVLTYVNTIGSLYGVRRALYEGFSMGFLTLLDRQSENMLVPLIYHHLLDSHGDPQSLLSQPPKHPSDGRSYVKFQNKARDRQYWLFQGDEQPVERDDYIITPYVERNLLNLVRATSTRRFPILIQGPTSAGKTSMIEYLANFTGNKFVRINNHEHTDLQEYLGTYVSGSDGKLKFQEGVLVQAMRQGHWIVLDELNLAPTDVLEALNRLLDDNRELLIPETQEVVRPHENFILFATQNPPGLYGGRKVLSRAFRNRFLELHFDDIPEDELEFILQQRSRNTSPPDCRRIVSVYKELSRLRQTSRLFEQKDSFATLRDLFRWALREAETREDIAAHGFMLLAERVRDNEERQAVKEIIETVFKVKIDTHKLYSARDAPELKSFATQQNGQGVVWTHAMRRLYVLVSRALKNNEPVLLVGETGCGKTTVCQLLAEALKTELHIVNAHQNTETGDLIGSQRPVRNRGAILDTLDKDLALALTLVGASIPASPEEKYQLYQSQAIHSDQVNEALKDKIASNVTRSKALFEWSDGALVEAMRDGQFFLLDEISLADDSVLERLNSVLEPQRTLLLAEKGSNDSFVVGAPGFQFFATMNPGGDFGKKELSPALRNRFTEIWVPQLSGDEDIQEIVQTKLKDEVKQATKVIIDFAVWFGATFRPMATTPFSIREILVWVQFMNSAAASKIPFALVHGASAIFIDSIGANPSAVLATDTQATQRQRQQCLDKLTELMGKDASQIYDSEPEFRVTPDNLAIGAFSIPRAPDASPLADFAFHAPTTRRNTMRVVRALQMHKPILLEGSPGVGKTSLVAALAHACGQPLTRINLSDQTDLMDLFGTDVPVEGAEAGNFAWRDAPFLQAMQKGEWVLLDEMNLASQSVLEGLNACLDHRGEVYVSELDQVFKRHHNFRLFAAQNPHHQGGGRKGLPASFVNRFIVVYADVFTDEDLKLIASHNFPNLPPDMVSNLIQFVTDMDKQLMLDRSFGAQGGPWEFNLRDVLRWLHLLNSSDPILQQGQADDFLDIMVRQRFRLPQDRSEVTKLYTQVFGAEPRSHSLYHDLNADSSQVGLALLPRNSSSQPERLPPINVVPRLPELESLMICVKQNIPCILTSPSGFGKTALLEYVAALSGKPLVVFPMNADIDTMDLVGGFEQADPLREVNAAIRDLRAYLHDSIMTMIPTKLPDSVLVLLYEIDNFSGKSEEISRIQSSVTLLLQELPTNSDVSVHLSKLAALLAQPIVLENPRFEWLDGVIIKALESGQWLVLDNANLCNASVLDRLNSLLEPNGFLSVNEHCGPGGEPRVVRPHPDFRIFLTVDPRYGELSRAMRNRAVEIYLCDSPPSVDPSLHYIAPVESCLQRYLSTLNTSQLLVQNDKPSDALRISLQNINLQDLATLLRFTNEFGQEPSLSAHLQQFVKFLQSPNGSYARKSVSDLYSSLPEALISGTAQSQPIHPLNNYAVSRLAQNGNSAEWIATIYDSCMETFSVQESIDYHKSLARTSKLGALNRLQRSLISDRVAAVSKDSTVRLAAFMDAVLSAIRAYLGNAPSNEHQVSARFLSLVWNYIERTIALATEETLDEARFQAHLTQGTRLLKKQLAKIESPALSALVSLILGKLQSDFASGFQLSTGLSMEQLWNTLRPLPIPSQFIYDEVLKLDQLVTRFDELRWKTRASIPELAKAQQAMEQAYAIVRSGASSSDELVRELSAVVESLESQTEDETGKRVPFFASQFEGLRQIDMLRAKPTAEAGNYELSILSDLSTRARLMLASTDGPASWLQYADCLAYQNQYPWDGRLMSSAWNKLNNIGSVTLNSFQLLEAELPALGRQMAQMTSDISADPTIQLNRVLQILLLDVFASHGEASQALGLELFSKASEFSALVDGGENALRDACSANENLPAHFMQIVLDHFIASIVGVAASKLSKSRSTLQSGLAWVQFTIGLTKLYVPDRIIDPQLSPMMERQFFEQLENFLRERLSHIHAFEEVFAGQLTSTRQQILVDEIDQLDPLPKEVVPVFRPERSELSQIHAEFSNVLKSIVGSDIITILQSHANSTDSDSGLALLKENIMRLLDRLNARFQAYQDITRPVSSLLRCFLIGLSLCDTSNAAKLASPIQAIASATPFVGGLQMSGFLPEADKSFEFLDVVNSRIAINGQSQLDDESRQRVFECFHSFFDEWSKRLEADRAEEAARTSMYRFRGSLEDEEEVDAEEFNELFPSYEEEIPSAKPKKNKDEVRNTSVKVAEIHKNLFLESDEPSAALRRVCFSICNRIVRESEGHASLDEDLQSKLIAPVVLLLSEKLHELQTPPIDKTYNFYSHANLTEARQLVAIVHDIRAKFRELQTIDEIGHMQPLVDVIQACDGVLELVHSEPLASIVHKVEHLHALVYEWQFGGWASQKYGALNLHNALTSTIIRWRRLELSTWGNLFDMEKTKCEEDAYSWWFIAYQVIIAVPLSMVDSKSELQTYATSLLQSLESYFSTSIVGQFQTRVSLLRQLLAHLRALIQDYPNLIVITQAVANFLAYYARFETAAAKIITTGRTPIDKKMKDVLLMASWKDTNITALRESAKKSHLKLFRLVRKFRGVLGQEMKTLIIQGLPDETTFPGNVSIAHPSEHGVSTAMLTLLESNAPGWLASHKRLANVTKTVSVMNNIANTAQITGTVAESVESYLSSLEESMAELRKETPANLTEENKTEVKHLKTRKRKLFADTLRELRNMGLRYNLAQEPLAEQESLAVVLASGANTTLDSSATINEAEYYFHKMLDLAPKVRDAARDHSEDLTSAEVNRSIGFVEGFIYLTRAQRRSIATTARSLGSLQGAVHSFTELRHFERLGNLRSRTVDSNIKTLLPWVLQLLKFGINLVRSHGKLLGTGHDSVLEKLQGWVGRLDGHLKTLRALPSLPTNLTSESYESTHANISDALDELRSELADLMQQSPNLSFVLSYISSWSEAEIETAGSELQSIPLANFGGILARLSDTILVAVEAAKKKAFEVPTNEEEPSWFVNHNDGLFSVIKQLRMDGFAKSVEQSLQLLEQLDLNSATTSSAAAGMIAVVSPILQEFVFFCQKAVENALNVHKSTTHLGYILTRAFTQIAGQGFCTPQEKSDETSGEGKVEAGTGLGDGEGADDISKDVQPSEDLTELAQEANKEESGEMEDEKDAVDMADEELEGDMGSVDGADEDDENGSKNGEEEEEENDMDEEAGDVDDLDPTAVDEKMWDGEDEEKADKDQQGDKAQGQKKDDDPIPDETKPSKEEAEKEADEDDKKDDNKDDNKDEEAEEEDEDVQAQEELNKQDQNVQENETLALPEEMDLDMKDEEEMSGDEDLDDLSDIDKDETAPEQQEDNVEEDEDEEAGDETQQKPADPEDGEEEGDEKEEAEEKNVDAVGEDEVDEEVKAEPEQEDKMEEEQQDNTQDQSDPADATELDNAAPSDVKSSGQDQNKDAMELDDQFQANAAEQNEGDMGEAGADENTSSGNKGAISRTEKSAEQQQEDAAEPETPRSDPFKKLGDALERWHRQQSDIKDAQPNEDVKQEQSDQPDEQAQREFQHLQDDSTAPDTQAMGTADNEDIQPMDETMAIDEEKQDPESRVTEGADEQQPDEIPDEMDTEEADGNKADNEREDDGRSGVKTRQGNYDREPTPEEDGIEKEEFDEDESLQNASEKLSITHISDEDRQLREFGDCLQEWSNFQTKTHSHSLSLTSQLRLILTPSQSTKLSGAFRTGKRLNIKRIIPYIASSYKRDKIWMRRSIPTKRTYQIMLCVDDSKSMGESSSGTLAMESLVMVSRSLTMLEVGQVGVLGFGADVFTAHQLSDPFSSDTGAKVLQKFSFSQDRTDIAQLLRQTIDNFRLARQQSGGGGAGADLWQLALILSDGLTPSSAHDEIRRLLREAMEERIMVVFIIMDDRDKKQGDSVLELKEAKFVNEGGESRVVIERYLDTFPFQYYLIVHNLEELPSALAGLLRTWFAEVNS
ncbi:Midasin [Akanthomyces lecanii RCEF 1005]|uniref:Midasin n=1 Tax=Akanthomyces lecanii RCEF 1005 TaxID=1081108 RepID=A0A168HG92_CORDF|nr:Midasin [Akanthomyces lecanii RCEF 1005]